MNDPVHWIVAVLASTSTVPEPPVISAMCPEFRPLPEVMVVPLASVRRPAKVAVA
ncbi:hypothetical protein QE406_001740 [Microbacterium testaceum]|uniref:hypothetical protein n=1 Tax=Microbacterium testaceum TaxID=2033 RepID=UPI0027862F32|nr:hypothetical protein [Microbacterium testaceum]MDQ1115731.1 hypothetical protein [Microbacterium testaceum]